MKCQTMIYRLFSLNAVQCCLPVLAVVLLCAGGCRRAGVLDDRERGNRIVAKAYEMVDLGDYGVAADLFRKALDIYPTMARPHLDLALLLHDRQKDYVRAIYHYNRYLELRPGTEKDDLLRARIQQAERAFVGSRITVNGEDGPTAMQLLEENGALRSRVESLEKSVAVQEKELETFRLAERRRLREQVITGGEGAVTDIPPVAVAASNAAVESVERAVLEPVTEPSVPSVGTIPLPVPEVERPVPVERPDAPTPRPALPIAALETVPSNAAGQASIERTYTVQRGDSLSRIAYKVYGDATRWRGIQEANSAVLGESVNVRVGQVLVIP